MLSMIPAILMAASLLSTPTQGVSPPSEIVQAQAEGEVPCTTVDLWRQEMSESGMVLKESLYVSDIVIIELWVAQDTSWVLVAVGSNGKVCLGNVGPMSIDPPGKGA